MWFEEQKLGVSFRVALRDFDELPDDVSAQTPQLFIARVTWRAEHLLEHSEELRLHEHRGHVQIYSDSMEQRDCTLDFPVVHLLPRLQAPRTCTDDFRVEQTAVDGGGGEQKRENMKN